MKTPANAMLLAAGLGTRMRPLTLTRPKPLVEIAGKALMDWTLDAAAAAGVKRAVVNVHHLAPMIVAHVSRRRYPMIVVSDETERLLDTGGGVVKALPLLGSAPFYVFNSDAIIAGGRPLQRLAESWQDDLDVLMLLQPRERAYGFDGAGDFFLAPDGGLRRRGVAPEAPYVYAGAYIIHPQALAGEQPVPFSMNRVWDRAIASGRMRGLVHDGDWYHVGTPEAVAETEALMARQVASGAIA